MDITAVERLLEAELAGLELELTDIGYIHSFAGGSVGAPPGLAPEPEDLNEMGDFDTAQETNKGLSTGIVQQYNDVTLALERVRNGTYGLCVTCGKHIERPRLAAYLSAKTCMHCMQES
jgi:hypothetical protein